MVRRWWLAAAAVMLLALGVAACGSDSSSSDTSSSSSSSGAQLADLSGTTVEGAGATFPEPLYKQWSQEFQQQTNGQVNYQGIGSGGGIAQFTSQTVGFGATDNAMTDEELKAAEKNGPVDHIPTVFGAVTVAYNVKGIDKGLKLDGDTIAGMFLGKIKTWDDPAIKKLNPDMQLPSTPVKVAHRSDESGTTGLFTDFLTQTSKAWKSGPGQGKTVEWPTGTGGKGNPGVAAAIGRSDGTVGYVELAAAIDNKLNVADVKNDAGQFIEPTLDSTSAAGEEVKVPSDLRFSAINAKGAKAYPIASATFLLVYQDLCKGGKLDQKKAKGVAEFAQYALDGGQDSAPDQNYAPLPDSIKSKAQKKVDALSCNGKPVSG